MTDKIIELLKESSADAWAITDKVTQAWEFYFIGHKLDQNRVRDVEHIQVDVFRKLQDGKLLGKASEEIAPTATVEEAKKIIEQLSERATFAPNPYYELTKETVQVENKTYDPQEIAKEFIEAMQQVPETDGEYINSYEIFAESCKRRFINSEGVDVTATYPNSMVEVVVNAKNKEHEIELYRMYKAGTCDKDHLVKEITDTLKFGKDRLVTKPTPNLEKATVLFSTEDAKALFQWAAMNMHAAYKFMGYSKFEAGKEILEDVTGDKITIKAVKELPNSSNNIAVDSEGSPVHDMYIIKDNVAQNYWGDCQFRHYMGVKDSFIVGNFAAEGGSSTEAELRCGKYLEPVEFSDFGVDEITGDIAGEIRLAYLHDGDKVTIVSGGSVSGNLNELMKNARFSKDLKQYNNIVVPAVVKLENVTIAGAEG